MNFLTSMFSITLDKPTLDKQRIEKVIKEMYDTISLNYTSNENNNKPRKDSYKSMINGNNNEEYYNDYYKIENIDKSNNYKIYNLLYDIYKYKLGKNSSYKPTEIEKSDMINLNDDEVEAIFKCIENNKYDIKDYIDNYKQFYLITNKKNIYKNIAWFYAYISTNYDYYLDKTNKIYNDAIAQYTEPFYIYEKNRKNLFDLIYNIRKNKIDKKEIGKDDRTNLSKNEEESIFKCIMNDKYDINYYIQNLNQPLTQSKYQQKYLKYKTKYLQLKTLKQQK